MKEAIRGGIFVVPPVLALGYLGIPAGLDATADHNIPRELHDSSHSSSLAPDRGAPYG